MPTIKSLQAIEILDSRGNPTVRAFLTLDTGESVEASVPSGASTGVHEAVELRDGDPRREMGEGVLKAVEHVNHVIAEAIAGMDVSDPAAVDKKVLSLDGTPNFAQLGANAALAVSMAVVRAAALSQRKELWQFINEHYFTATSPAFPRLMVNIVNGGKHANWNFDIQEFMIVPKDIEPSRSVRVASEIFHHLGLLLKEHNLSILVGDEGGYSPALTSNEEVIDMIVQAGTKASYELTQHYDLALDSAASEWFQNGTYVLPKQNKSITRDVLTQYYLQLQKGKRIMSFEDPFAQDDWDSWVAFTKLATDFMVVGDDLYATNPTRLQKGIQLHASNAILIKLNQIGTVTETVETMKLARSAGMRTIVSHRSGETEDTFIADLAYGSGADFIKTGSMSRSEHLAKYNRLLEIEKGL
jgi:enolase